MGWVCQVCGHAATEDLFPLCRDCADVVRPTRTRHLRLAWSRVDRVTHNQVTVKGAT